VRHGARGFTLIELAVVMLLLVIVLAMIDLKSGDQDTDAVRNESERLALLLQTAQQEAILQGEVIAVELTAAGYQFAKLDDKNKFQPLSQDEIFRARQLPEGVILQNAEGGAETKNADIVFMPSGELTAFTITLSRGKAQWRVEGKANGEIKPAPRV